MADVALAAGFGLDFERCDAEVFAAVVDLLEQRAQESKRSALLDAARRRLNHD